MGKLRVAPCAIGVSGRIGSGKTTISQAIADAVECPLASFGEFIRSAARNSGLNSESRDILQSIGDSLIAKGWPQFCRDVLNAANWQPSTSIIVDGIRHTEAVKHLSAIVAPLPFILVHVDVEETLRGDRVRQRLVSSSSNEAESHGSEAAAKIVLPEMADVRVDGSAPLSTSVAIILSFLERRMV